MRYDVDVTRHPCYEKYNSGVFMKKFVFLACVLFSTSAFAENHQQIRVKCATPRHILGVYSVIDGKLELKLRHDGTYSATGIVGIRHSMSGRRTKGVPEAIRLRGEYNPLRNRSLATLEAVKDLNVSGVVMNFKDTEMRSKSFVEYKNGDRIPYNCGSSAVD